MIIAANSVCLLQCDVFVTVKGIFLCLHESRNAVWQLDVLWGLQKEPNASLSLGSCGMWGFSPFLSLAHVCFSPCCHLPPFFKQEPQKFRSVQSTKQTTFFFFPKQSAVFWLLRVTPLPNMHENVTVCLEAVCRACKFKPQTEDQRQTEMSPQPEKPSWLL